MARVLGLGVDHVPWHVARDGVAEFGMSCALLASTAGRFAREVIELSRTEIGEVAEMGGHLRGASSTMPQKRNPISSEVVVGMAGVAEGLAGGLLAAMRPTHERSAGEWQMEWVLVPELAQLAAGALHNAGMAAAGLSVFADKMAENLLADGSLLLAEAYMMRLARALGRERAHDLVYEAVGLSRSTGTTLTETTRSLLAESEGDEAAALLDGLEPKDYVGDVALSCELAVRRWRRDARSQSDAQEVRGDDR
jgi:3-carboxy-cis,cis-muconate cycloisomerase